MTKLSVRMLFFILQITLLYFYYTPLMTILSYDHTFLQIHIN